MPPMKNEAKILARFNPTLVTPFASWRPAIGITRDPADFYRDSRDAFTEMVDLFKVLASRT